VRNTGTRTGQEIVQLYLSDKVCSITPAGKQLKGFEKITLEPNESRIVHFTISKEDLMFADQKGQWKLEPGIFSIAIENLVGTFELN
jgi:beta-glucosidase